MMYSNDDIIEIKEASVVSELPESVVQKGNGWDSLSDVEIPEALKDHVSQKALQHRKFRDDEFWKRIPAFRNISRDEFLDTKFQNKNSITEIAQFRDMLAGVVETEFIEDIEKGMSEAPMNIRISPYILSLIDWDNPYKDPLRTQFIPVSSTRKADHPRLTLDSLHEQDDAPVPGLVHRYFDKALFLPLDVCPVYCRFCTRSYAIGGDTDQVSKMSFKPIPKKWHKAFAYIASRPEIEDIVISGGDTFMLAPVRLRQIGEMLLSIPHVRRLRFASKGPAVMPMKILTDTEWTDALVNVVNLGRDKGKEVVLHTHFNSPNEITRITYDAMMLLFKKGVKVRNQSVLIRGVNDSVENMSHLVRKLSQMNVQPYYVYQHDMVKGVEELRTRIADTVELERHIRGLTAGFNTPLFVTDAPGGGGKRDVHSYDYYDEVSGISVYRSPSVDREKIYLYFDPIDLLPEEGKNLWMDPANHTEIIENAIIQSGYDSMRLAM
jgi:lysine 2,3-aminomutase